VLDGISCLGYYGMRDHLMIKDTQTEFR